MLLDSLLTQYYLLTHQTHSITGFPGEVSLPSPDSNVTLPQLVRYRGRGGGRDQPEGDKTVSSPGHN